MIENVKTHNETITIYTTTGITYNGNRDFIKSFFKSELEDWQRKRKQK